MERVVRFLGNMLLKCQNRTLTNLVLHDLSVSDVSTIYMARSIPCIRQHAYNSMVDTEHAIWERVILFVGKCLDHDQDNQSETVKNLCEVMRGAKHETPVPEDTYNIEPITSLTGPPGLGHGGNVTGGKIRPSTRNVLSIEGGGDMSSPDPPRSENQFYVGLKGQLMQQISRVVTRTEWPEPYVNFIPQGATIFYMGDNFTLPTVPSINQISDRNKEDETVVKYFGTDAVTMYDTTIRARQIT